MQLLSKFFVCLWHTLMRNDFAIEQSYQEFVTIEEQKQKRKLEKKAQRNIKSSLDNVYHSFSNSRRPAPSKSGLVYLGFPIPIFIVHLNQVMVGTKTVTKSSYLYGLFVNCKTNKQVVATAEFYLSLLDKPSLWNDTLTLWVRDREEQVKCEITALDNITNHIYMQTYARPIAITDDLEPPTYKSLEYSHTSGDCKRIPEYFVLCNTPLERHYTAAWYMEHFCIPELPTNDTRTRLTASVFADLIKSNASDTPSQYQDTTLDQVLENVRYVNLRKGAVSRTLLATLKETHCVAYSHSHTSKGTLTKKVTLTWYDLASRLEEGGKFDLTDSVRTSPLVQSMIEELNTYRDEYEHTQIQGGANLSNFEEVMYKTAVLITWLKSQDHY